MKHLSVEPDMASGDIASVLCLGALITNGWPHCILCIL